MKAGFVMLLLVAIGSTASAQKLRVEGDFSVTVTGGFAYAGSFRGTIDDIGSVWPPVYHSDEFSSFTAELTPPLIGDTLFDASNLEVLLDYRNERFTQLWFGGDSIGPNGVREGVDDFFVQWSNEIGTPPDTGFFSVTGSSNDVTILGGDLDIHIVPEPSSWMLGITGATTLLCMLGRKLRRRNR